MHPFPLKACDWCRCRFPDALLAWMGYGHYCPECFSAYWQGAEDCPRQKC